MANKDDKYKVDGNFLGGFQEVFDMTNDNQKSSASSTTNRITDTNISTKNKEQDEDPELNDDVKTVDPSFFEEQESTENNEEVENEQENEEEETEKQPKKKQTQTKQEEPEASEEEGEEVNEEEENAEEEDSETSGSSEESEEANEDSEGYDESEIVDSFFDLFTQELGWKAEDEEKPKSMNELVEYMNNLVEETSKSLFASDEVVEINNYVANGGSIEDYVKAYSEEKDVENIDINDNVENQKWAIREQLRQSGISDNIIEKRIERYEDTGILEDEAEESLELLKKYNNKKKEELLKEKENQRKQAVEKQQKFINDVKNTIDGKKDIKGIPISKQQKEDLKRYLFEADSNGQTQYQKDYAKSYNNLVETAFFLKEGDSALKTIQKRAGSDAAKHIRKKLGKQKQTKRSKNQTYSKSGSSSLDMIAKISKNLSN